MVQLYFVSFSQIFRCAPTFNKIHIINKNIVNTKCLGQLLKSKFLSQEYVKPELETSLNKFDPVSVPQLSRDVLEIRVV